MDHLLISGWTDVSNFMLFSHFWLWKSLETQIKVYSEWINIIFGTSKKWLSRFRVEKKKKNQTSELHVTCRSPPPGRVGCSAASWRPIQVAWRTSDSAADGGKVSWNDKRENEKNISQKKCEWCVFWKLSKQKKGGTCQSLKSTLLNVV